MRKSRPRYPRQKEVTLVLRALEAVPRDVPFRMGWRESEHYVPNWRVQTQTNEIEWTVDIYAGGYYIVRVGSRLTEEVTSVSSLVGYLCRMLRVQRVSKPV
jgi:hypothetical protein